MSNGSERVGRVSDTSQDYGQLIEEAHGRAGIDVLYDALADAVEAQGRRIEELEAVMFAIIDATSGPGDGPSESEMVAGVAEALTMPAVESAMAKWAALTAERDALQQQLDAMTTEWGYRDIDGWSGVTPEDEEYARRMGTRHPGEIAAVRRLVSPWTAVEEDK